MSDINLVSKEFSNNHYLKTRIEDESVFVDGPVKFTGTVLGANGSPFITGPIPKTEFNYVREDTSEQLLFLGEGDTINFNTVKMWAGTIDIRADNLCNIYGSVRFTPGYYGSIVVDGPMYDKNGNEITGGGSKWVVEESGMGQTWVSLGKDKYGTTVNSVFVSGPLYDKDGKEIKGGGGSGGEAKAKKWYCNISMGASDCKFWNLTPASESEIESIKVIVNDGNNALITFKEEKSMNEVNEWLIFRAKLIMGMEAIYDAGLNYFMATAICPWPEDKPWPESN